MEDKLIPAEIMLPIWQKDFKNLSVQKIEKAGHFPEEEQSENVLKVLKSELENWEEIIFKI